ncbi:hypothetical protein F2Q69_00048405 [Brassica cretica]|uniref:Uncharacterized protein n=1 Tax=Brassica cretica TaxID=69181 RepID=A0A8S9PT43_BRACR|nr:hypothetical protein F2Q69_00048405 [Brassica cretica]
MEKATAKQIQNTQEVTPEAEKKGNNQQEISYINRHGYLQNNQAQGPESNQQAPPAPANGPPYEQKGLGMMMEQLLQGQHVQAKALNQVTTDINTMMDNMFTELKAARDAPRKNDKNSRAKHGNEIEQLFAETALGTKERIEHHAACRTTALDEPAETPPVRVYVPIVPYPVPPRHLMDPIRPSPTQTYFFSIIFTKME